MIRYQITDGSAGVDETRWVERLRTNVDFIQVREPDLSAGELSALVRRVMGRVDGPLILVNDRIDVAIACGAAGVHLRAGSISPYLVWEQGRFIVTAACHSEEDVERAAGADYVLVSPVFRPLSKRDVREPLGLEGLARMVRIAGMPVIALGGITEENAAACMEAGAVGVAGITLFRSEERLP